MIVKLRKHQLNYFRRKAAKADLEVEALLIGRRISPTLVEVTKFKYPKLEIQTKGCVLASEESYQHISENAKDNGQTVVGTIHSHIEYTPVMSKADHQTHISQGDAITGIVGLVGGKSWVEFWVANSSLPCKVEYF